MGCLPAFRLLLVVMLAGSACLAQQITGSVQGGVVSPFSYRGDSI
jgi:hypothetical protein